MSEQRKEDPDHTDHDVIRALLVGRTVTKVDEHTLLLDNGTRLDVRPNEGGCICGAGDYQIDELNDCPVNVITNVDFEDRACCGDEWNEPHVYRIFVWAENERLKLLEVSGDDGNGYYGSGYWIAVSR